MQDVLIKLSFDPERNYCGAMMIDYRIIKRNIADILVSYVKKYKNNTVTFYCGFDGSRKIKYINIAIIDDPEIIDAYLKLKNNDIIENTYYVYDILIESLVNYYDDDNWKDSDEITDNDIISMWHDKLNIL